MNRLVPGVEAGSEVYSECLTNELVAAKRKDYENGITSRQSFQNLRKGAVFISSFVNTGHIDLSRLPSINTCILCSGYEVTLDSFCDLMLKEHRLKRSSVQTIRSAIRNFLLGLESIGVFSLDKLDRPVVNHCITITAKRYPRGAGSLLYAMRLFLGYLYENVIAQILTANGNELFYHTFPSKTSRHNYEIDFLLAKRNKICPIEVKSSGFKAHASLDHFSQKYSSRILWKYLVYTKDYDKDQDVICLPVYMVPFL